MQAAAVATQVAAVELTSASVAVAVRTMRAQVKPKQQDTKAVTVRLYLLGLQLVRQVARQQHVLPLR